MKLVSLNMEGERHIERVLPFLKAEAPETICLLEAPQLFQHHLQELGYHTSFAPMLVRERDHTSHNEGIILASKHPFTCEEQYYHGSRDTIKIYQGAKEAISNVVLLAQIDTPEGDIRLLTTHVMVTPHGASNEHQRRGIRALLEILDTQPPHIICGDFNMPRGHNDQYPLFTERYTDSIPDTYASSLDRNLHQLGSDPTLQDPIFDAYMVDYVFTQEPYQAENVRLEFDVSDHAAVIADIRT